LQVQPEFSQDADDRIFLNGLKDFDKPVCQGAFLVCCAMTKGQQTLQEMQLQAVLEKFHSIDGLISAGSGSGKTGGWQTLFLNLRISGCLPYRAVAQNGYS
jgi:hypothetical protein